MFLLLHNVGLFVILPGGELLDVLLVLLLPLPRLLLRHLQLLLVLPDGGKVFFDGPNLKWND